MKSVSPKDFKGPYIKLDSGVLTLQTGAAYKAYNKFGIIAMKGFAMDVGLKHPHGSDLFDYVDVMCRHHLQDHLGPGCHSSCCSWRNPSQCIA